MHNLCTENYQSLLENIKEDQSKLARYATFMDEKTRCNKNDNSLKLIYKFNLISAKSQ
jgi:hypothetical protein